MQTHRISLFGQKVAILLDSSDWSDPHIYLRFLKKKDENNWEKPSSKEGKVIKINLLESIAIRDLCNANSGKWSTVHVFGEEKTSITFEKEGQNIKINIPGYSKYIQYPESTLFAELMSHLVSEKIQNATGGSQVLTKLDDNVGKMINPPQPIIQPQTGKTPANIEKIQPSSKANVLPPNTPISPEIKEILDGPVEYPFDDEDLTPANTLNPGAWMEALQKNDEYCLIPGQVTAQRPKAIAFQIMGKNQIWIPLSTIQNLDQAPSINGIWVKQWWLEKNLDKIGSA